MDQRERYPDEAEETRLALEWLQSRIWTALPCVVQAFPSTSGLGPMILDAQPTISGSYLNSSGVRVEIQMPLLINVPVAFPRGGGVSLTFPIKQGDECLVVFSARCIDAWWAQGAGVAPNPGRLPPDVRMHDLSDGIAYVGLTSNPNAKTVAPNILDPLGALLTSDDGTTYLLLGPGAKAMRMVAPGGITLNGVTIDTNGNVVVPGNLTSDKTITGNTDVKNGAGTSLTNHVHPTGSPDTGPPVPGT